LPIQFSYPIALLLLPPLLFFCWWLHRHTVTDMSVGRKRLALTLRCILVTLLVLVLAGTKIVKRGESLAVVFVVDASKSVREDQRNAIEKYIADASKGMRTVDKVGVITFAQDPHTQSSPGQPLDPARLRDPGMTTATDIAQALRAAKNELDSAAKDSGKRIVLLSDGNENAGHALSEVPSLAAGHIVLDTITLPVTLTKETLIEKMALPSRVKIGEPFPVRVVVNSLTMQTATVSLTKDGKPTGETKRVELHPGKNVVVFDQSIDKVGFYRYNATLDAPDDTIPENNKGEGFVWVRGKPTVLYVADSPALTGFLRSALKSQSIDVEYAPPSALPANAADLQRYDSIFLSNVLGSDLSQNQMLALQVSCRDFGIGFGMVGGPQSFGAGYYRGTPIEETLPVTMDVKKQKRIPSVAVALVIEDLEIPTTVNMSKEAAKATVDNLEPIDQVGVLDCAGYGGLGFGGGGSSPSGTWRIQMQHVEDREAIKGAMDNLTGMGDPPSYDPYLLEAARVLNNTDAKVKHIVFLGDGDAIYEANQGAVAANMKKIRDMGITVSTIVTGADNNESIKFMATMAYVGGGQSYIADKPQDLPRLLLKDQQTISQPPIIEEPFQPVPIQGDEVFKGIDWGSAPPLLGYNISNLKPTAELSLISHRKDPIFAGWRYGLGRAVAFMSDDRAKWAAPWINWSGYSKFWAQAVRWTLRPFAPSDYNTQVVMDSGRGHISVDAIDPQGHYVNKLDFTAHVAQPSNGALKAPPSLEQVLHQTGPGHYEGWFDAPRIGTYLVNVTQKKTGGPNTSTVVGLSTAYSPEYKDTQANRYLMTQLASAGSGRTEPTAGSIFGGDRPAVYSAADMVPLFLLLAMLLLPFDIAVRRLAVDLSDARRAMDWLRARTAKAVPQRGGTPELGRLLDRKGAVVAEREEELAMASANGFATPVSPTINPPERTSTPAAPRPATATTPSATSRTLRPEGLEAPPPLPTEPAPAPVPRVSEPAPEEAGMSRLMAAKLRARQQQDKEREQ
jgi:Ca-activated chloride channel family protein